MRKPAILAAAAALAIAGGAAGALVARAAPPPPAGPGAGPPAFGGPHAGPGWHHWMHGRAGAWHHRRLITPGTFALLYHPANREITTADAQTIATGFLRWNGNHTWKVVDVQSLADGKIGFAYATPDNTVIARFTIDSRTGQIQRVG